MFFFIESNGMPSASYAFGDGEPREAMPCMASLLFLLSCGFKESKNKPRIACFLKKKPCKTNINQPSKT
jgi:hypothetical protein